LDGVRNIIENSQWDIRVRACAPSVIKKKEIRHSGRGTRSFERRDLYFTTGT